MALTADDVKQVETHLKEQFFLVRRETLLAVLAVAGVVTVGGAFTAARGAIESSVAKQAEATILAAKATALAAKATATKANDSIQRLLADVQEFGQQSGYLRLGDTLICYGAKEYKTAATTHTAEFAFDFPQEFSEAPIITHTLNTFSNGNTYGAFRHTIDTKTYTGIFTECQGKNAANDITMSYIAIGKVAQATDSTK